MATVATVLSMTKKVKLLTSTNNVCSNEESRKNKCHNNPSITSITTADKVYTKIQPICYRSKQKKKLL